MKLGVLNLIFILIIFFISFSSKSEPLEGNVVEIQILDKISAKINNITINVNESNTFETLKIDILSCFKNPPEEIPEDFVLLRIHDRINKDLVKLVYQGWMISSSPSSTPLEHPIYDLWIKSCKLNDENNF